VKKNSLINNLLGSLPIFSFDENSGSSSETTEQSGQLTGVARYLDEKGSVTGVEKYLKKHPHDPATGVARYVAKRIVSNKPAATGVSKYITKKSVLDHDKPGTSSVEKYVIKQSLKPKPVITGVSLYLIRRKKEEQDKIPATSVGKFLWQKEIEIKKALAKELIARYVAVEAEAAKKAAEQPEEPEKKEEEQTFDPAETGVAQYLARVSVEKNRTATGVTRYVAKKMTIIQSIPEKTSVEKYLAKQAALPKEVPTGVSRYVVKKVLLAQAGEQTTGVDKYVNKKELQFTQKPGVSSVAKYLLRLSILKKDSKPEVVENNAINEEYSEEEHIDSATGVEKYLEKKAELRVETDADLTRVEKYVAEKTKNMAGKEKKLTSVERYLKNKAA